ncbi:MAG: lipoprotein [Pseudomonadota bacterium]
MRIPTLILILVFTFAGCGQKGPLYLPTNKPSAQKPSAPQPSAVITPDPERPTPSQAVPPPKSP